MAGEAQGAFLSIGPSDILSKYVGESEAAVRSVFVEAIRMARDNHDGNKCTVLFFDEIDALGQSRGHGSGGGNSFGGNGNTSGGTTGSESNGGGGGDNPSRRVLAELLIQLNKVNESRGTFDSPLITKQNEEDTAKNDGSLSSSPEEGYEAEIDSRKEDYYYDGEDSMDASGNQTTYEDEAVAREECDAAYDPHRKERSRAGVSKSDRVDNEDCGVRIIVVAATNRPEDCDPALIRRFAIQVPVGLPTARDRKKILKRNMKDIEHTINKKQFSDLSLVTDGWSGSDLQSIAREAAMAPVRECIRRAALLKRRKVLSSPCTRGKMRKEQQRRFTHDQLQREEKKSGDGIIMARDLRGERKSSMNLCRAIDQSNGKKKADADDDGDDTSFSGPQKRLLEEFRNLRPVSFQDYIRALTFWFSRKYSNVNDSPLAKFGLIEESEHENDIGGSCGVGFWNEHYDSSSDEEGEEEENILLI